MAFYVRIEKKVETNDSITYRFFEKPATVGTLLFDKRTGEPTLLSPLAGDEKNRLYMRAAMKIRQNWKSGTLSDVMEWAS